MEKPNIQQAREYVRNWNKGIDNYIEKGLAIKANANAIKQMWIEYRLIYNDKNKKNNKKREVKEMEKVEEVKEELEVAESYVLNNFDDIFDRLSMKVDGVGRYVQELKDLQEKLDSNKADFEREREIFRREKIEFEEYKTSETKKLDKKDEELKQQIEKIENLIKAFDLKVSDVVNK